MMRRRDFLTRLAGGVAATAGRAIATRADQGHASRADHGGMRFRIAVSTWSLHNYFPATRSKDFSLPGRMLEMLEFPEMIADRYQIHRLELVAPHFSSTEASYLEDLKKRLAKAHAHVVNIPVDIKEIWTGGGLSDPEDSVRREAVKGAVRWIDIAAEIGSLAVRCDPGKMDPRVMQPTIESYQELAAYGAAKGVQVTIENHGGVGSEHPEELVGLFQAVGSESLGALPDFGNFPDEATRQRGLAMLFPFARVLCHAKGLEIDAEGNETKFDFPKCMEIARSAGFKGVYSVEYEGPGDPYEGVQKVIDQLLRCL